MLQIYLNGTTIIARTRIEAVDTAAHPTEHQIVCEYELSATDYVELRVFQNSGGALDVEDQNEMGPVFGMRRVG